MKNVKRVLECSSRGDKRFSAFYALVEVNGVRDSIENHYQNCKRSVVGGVSVVSGKGKKVDHMVLGDKSFSPKHLSSFYNLLWIKYLDKNQNLVDYAKEFDEFNDMFKGSSINCQADVIRKYVIEGREVLMDSCKEFIDLIRS